MSNLSKGTGSRKDTKMRIRAFPVSPAPAPRTRGRGQAPHARPEPSPPTGRGAAPPPAPAAGREPPGPALSASESLAPRRASHRRLRLSRAPRPAGGPASALQKGAAAPPRVGRAWNFPHRVKTSLIPAPEGARDCARPPAPPRGAHRQALSPARCRWHCANPGVCGAPFIPAAC